MIDLAEEKFKDPENEFSTFHYNKYHFRHEEDLLDGTQKLDLEELRKQYTKDEKDRLVYACISNNECLPFNDNSFNCYIAALSL